MKSLWKIIIASVILSFLAIFSMICDELGLNTFGIPIFTLLLFEMIYIIFSKKEYRIIIGTLILFLIWLQFFSLGVLTNTQIKEDLAPITKKLNVQKVEYGYIHKKYDYNEKSLEFLKKSAEINARYDALVPYVLYRVKDTLQLEMKYKKVKTIRFGLPTKKWQLIKLVISP
ncbi:MAG: hypothetical protein V1720_14960 [bacterium]